VALSKEAYKALENIVGPDYISDDPALLDSYTYPMATTSLHMGPCYNTFTPRGQAVLLPGSTEEVQAIVKACNKYKIKYKASSTFWAAMGYPSEDKNTIQLDMRRMDRILEIDAKNMLAVIEPHVIGSTLQAEAMKVGLNAHIHGPGCSCSPLASATSYGGMGPDTIFMGSGDEILLGVEWVMPNGELLRIGSPGSGLGWFYGEGPGPSVKGLIRGGQGGKGAMGVFTKCAVKLSAWPGPAGVPVEGIVPAYQAALPDNFRAYTLAFPTWQAWADAAHMIWDAGIGYIAHRQFNMLGRKLKGGMLKILTDPTKTLSDLEEVLKDPQVQKMTEEMERDFQFVLAGMTPRDIEWQEKALDKILADTGGRRAATMKDDPVLRNWMLLYLVKLGHKNLNLVYAGGYDGCFGLMGPPDYGTQYVEEAAKFKEGWEKKGTIVSAGGDCMMGGVATIGGGATVVWENFTCWDPYDKESTEGAFEFFEATSKYGVERHWGGGMEKANIVSRGNDGYETPKEVRERMLAAGPQPETYRYQRKIREAFNPNDLGDAYYLTL
jgi:FAD/FMN-containing dehydrogenase